MKLHSEADPVSGLYLQGLLQHSGRLLPVRVLAEGADADLLVQVDVVPEGNCSYSACRRRLDLGNRDYGLTRIFFRSKTKLFQNGSMAQSFISEKSNSGFVLNL